MVTVVIRYDFRLIVSCFLRLFWCSFDCGAQCFTMMPAESDTTCDTDLVMMSHEQHLQATPINCTDHDAQRKSCLSGVGNLMMRPLLQQLQSDINFHGNKLISTSCLMVNNMYTVASINESVKCCFFFQETVKAEGYKLLYVSVHFRSQKPLF